MSPTYERKRQTRNIKFCLNITQCGPWHRKFEASAYQSLQYEIESHLPELVPRIARNLKFSRDLKQYQDFVYIFLLVPSIYAKA